MLVLATGSLLAQVTTSSVQGSVTDDSGEVVIGATVRAVHEPSGSVYGAVTNLEGRFNLPNMRVGGPYTSVVSFIGFEPQTYSGIVLRLGEPYALNAVITESFWYRPWLAYVRLVATFGIRAKRGKWGAMTRRSFS